MANNSNETVPTRFLKTVEKWGDRVAMRKKEFGLWHDISWNAYHDQVRSVACALMSLGLESGDTVAIIGDIKQPANKQFVTGNTLTLHFTATHTRVQLPRDKTALGPYRNNNRIFDLLRFYQPQYFRAKIFRPV